MQTATVDSFVAIKDIGATIDRISEIATTVTAAIEQHGGVTSEIAQKVQQVADATSRVAAEISEVNRNASEIGLASGQVLSSAELLSNESTHLKPELDGFLAKARTA